MSVGHLRELLEAATPRPWSLMRTGIISEAEEFDEVDDGDEFHFGSCTVATDEIDHPEDAALIVGAVNALPALLTLAESAAPVAEWFNGGPALDPAALAEFQAAAAAIEGGR